MWDKKTMINEKVLKYYQNLHQSRLNLILHIIGSFLFISANIFLLHSLFTVDLYSFALSFAVISLSIILQGIGHQFEPEQFEGFKGPVDFVRTFYLELVIVFPVFLFSPFFKENWNKGIS